MPNLPNPFQIGADINAFGTAVGAYFEAKRDADAHPEDTNASVVLATAKAVVGTAAAACAGDASKFIASTKFGSLAKLAGLATAVANIETFICNSAGL